MALTGRRRRDSRRSLPAALIPSTVVLPHPIAAVIGFVFYVSWHAASACRPATATVPILHEDEVRRLGGLRVPSVNRQRSPISIAAGGEIGGV